MIKWHPVPKWYPPVPGATGGTRHPGTHPLRGYRCRTAYGHIRRQTRGYHRRKDR